MNNMEDERECVRAAYDYARANNKMRYNNGSPDATEEYIFENQMIDANNIISEFYNERELRVISIIKQCKVGMDGLMIELSVAIFILSVVIFILSVTILLSVFDSNISFESFELKTSSD